MAHARITRVDVRAGAASCPAWSPRSAPPTSPTQLGALPCAWPVTAGHGAPRRTTPLATDEVRHVGDGVAVVVATDRYAAADALEAIEVDYEPLPAGASTWRRRSTDGSPLVHADKGTNKCFTVAVRLRRLRRGEAAGRAPRRRRQAAATSSSG